MKNIQQAEHRLKAMGNMRRLTILKFLHRKKYATVGEIQQELKLSMFATSQHLRILRSAGLVSTTKRGRYVSYRLPLKQDGLLKEVLRLV